MLKRPTIGPRREAVLIGINQYQAASITSLTSAFGDATKLGGFLSLLPGGYNVTHLDPQTYRSKSDVRRALIQLCAELQAGDELIVFFAGHGCLRTVNGRDEHLLLLTESRPELLEYFDEALAVSFLLAVTEVEGLRRLFILDACRNRLDHRRGGALEGFRGVASLRNLVATRVQARPSPVTLVCACDEGRCAQESSDIGGLFTQAWLKELQERMRAGATTVVDTALLESVATRMNRLAAEYGLEVNQRPWLEIRGQPYELIGDGFQTIAGAKSPGRDVARDTSVHVDDLREMAMRGDCAAQAELAECFLFGRGVTMDASAAFFWYRRAAESGYAVAMYQAGNLTERGEGCPKDMPAAVAWYRRAAEKDQPHALLRLGLLHRDGRGGVEKSRAEARRLLERAALRGLAEAQYHLACLLVDDAESETDHSVAEDWFRRAAQQGHPKACYMAGCLAEIRANQGDLRARAEVAEFLLKAIEGGVAAAVAKRAEWLRRNPDCGA